MFNKKFINKIKLRYVWIKRPACRQAGMTYVELIVVMGIFGTMSSIIMFNYGDFRARIDVKNLSSDIALSIVKAQKNSVSGKLPSTEQIDSITLSHGDLKKWRPSYGVYFNSANQNNFIYFTDLDAVQNGQYDGATELSELFTINNNNKIKSIKYVGTTCNTFLQELTISFKRPSSTPAFNINPPYSDCQLNYYEITVTSGQSTPIDSKILIYPSGRVDLK